MFRGVLAGLVIVSALAAASSPDDGGAAQYRQAFYANAKAALDRMMASNPGREAEESESIAKTAELLTDCHMRVMAVYSPALQESAYAVIRNGGSYLQAKAAFNAAITTESAAGGERAAAAKQMFDKAMQVGQECLKPQ